MKGVKNKDGSLIKRIMSVIVIFVLVTMSFPSNVHAEAIDGLMEVKAVVVNPTTSYSEGDPINVKVQINGISANSAVGAISDAVVSLLYDNRVYEVVTTPDTGNNYLSNGEFTYGTFGTGTYKWGNKYNGVSVINNPTAFDDLGGNDNKIKVICGDSGSADTINGASIDLINIKLYVKSGATQAITDGADRTFRISTSASDTNLYSATGDGESYDCFGEINGSGEANLCTTDTLPGDVTIQAGAAASPITAVGFTATSGLQAGNANVAVGATVGTLSTTGGDAPVSYAMKAGDGTNDADNAKFSISGTAVKVAPGVTLTAGTYKFYVEATDVNSSTSQKACTITVAAAASTDATLTTGSALATAALSGTSTGGKFTGGASSAESAALTVTIPDPSRTNAALSLTKGDANSTIKYVKKATAPTADSDYDSPYTAGSTNVTVTDGEVIWLMVTAQDGMTKLYYKLTVKVGPTFADTYPKAGVEQAVGSKQVEILVKADETGNAKYVVVANNATSPTALDVENQVDGTGSTPIDTGSAYVEANTEVSFVTNALPADNTDYDVYVIVRGNSYSNYTSVKKVDVKTPAAASTNAAITAGTLAGHSFTGTFTGGSTRGASSAMHVNIENTMNINASLLLTKGSTYSAINYVKQASAPSFDTDYNKIYNEGSTYLSPSNNDVYWLMVTAQDGITKKYYKLTVTVAAAPAFTSGYPKAGTAQADGTKKVQVLAKADAAGTSYYVVVTDGATTPSAVQIKAGQDASSAAAISSGSAIILVNTEKSIITKTLPADATDYDVFVIVDDGTLPSEVKKVDVKTPNAAASPITAVSFIATSGLQAGNANVAEGATVGTLSTTGGDAPVSYAMKVDGTNDTDNAKFAISGASVKVATGVTLGAGTYKFYVEATDVNNSKAQKACTITVAAAASPIAAAGVTGVVAPAAGSTPTTSGELTAAAGTYTVSKVTWQNGDGTAASLVNGKFKAESDYLAVIELTSAAGNKFPATGIATPTANIGTASVGTTSGGDVSGNKLTYVIEFVTTGAKTVSSISVKTQPTKLTYVAGENLDLTGLVATLTYNDTSTTDAALAVFEANGITANPTDGTVMVVATHNGNPVTLTCNAKTAATNNLVVNATVAPIAAAGVTGVVAPAAGATPTTSGALTAAAGTYTVSNVTWQNGDGTAASLVNGKFKAASTYLAVIELTSAAGNKFPATGIATPTANIGTASEGTTSGGDVSGNKLTYVIEFAATGAKTVSSISVKTQPTKLTYVAGENLDLTGLAATLTYNDTSTTDAALAVFEANGITANPTDGTVMVVATHNGNPVTLTCNAKTATTNNLVVNATASTDATLTTGSALATVALSGVSTGGKFTGGTSSVLSSALTVTIPDASKTNAALSLTKGDSSSTIKYVKQGSAPTAESEYASTYTAGSTKITVADNDVIWLMVTAQDTTTKLYYKLTVTVAAASSDAGLTSVATKTDATPGELNGDDTDNLIGWEVSVDNAKATLGRADVVVAANATFKLYKDGGFTTEVAGAATMDLAVGDTVAFIKVTAQNGTPKYYSVVITRAAPSPNGIDVTVTAIVEGSKLTGAASYNGATIRVFRSMDTTYTAPIETATVTNGSVNFKNIDANTNYKFVIKMDKVLSKMIAGNLAALDSTLDYTGGANLKLLKGDLNGDDQVNLSDLTIFKSSYNKDSIGDLDDSSSTGLSDLTIFKGNYNKNGSTK